MVFLGREFDSEIKFNEYSSGKKTIFQNVQKMAIFSIPCGTKNFSEHFQAWGPRNSRSQTPITLYWTYNMTTFREKVFGPILDTHFPDF